MAQSITAVTIVVADYDQAISYYCDLLGFSLVEDTPMADGKRWVLVAPRGTRGAEVLLARADGPKQAARVGDQTGGRVAFFLATDNIVKDHADLSSRGVKFLETPRDEPYGQVAVFEDIYGNKWDLIQPAR